MYSKKINFINSKIQLNINTEAVKWKINVYSRITIKCENIRIKASRSLILLHFECYETFANFLCRSNGPNRHLPTVKNDVVHKVLRVPFESSHIYSLSL